MKPSILQVNELKLVLDNIGTPSLLDDHPWTKCLAVQEEVLKDPSLGKNCPGYNLILVLSHIFSKMIPSTPPRRGKRLDTRWCQFGMLAAQYFAPFSFGAIFPTSLRDAWGRIDQVIPLFVFGKHDAALEDTNADRYRLFDDDEEPAPYSTLSDWHIKGLERLYELFTNQEQYLSHILSRPSSVLDSSLLEEAGIGNNNPTTIKPILPIKQPSPKKSKRYFALLTALVILILLASLGTKGWRIYQRVLIVRNDITKLEDLVVVQMDVDTFQAVGSLLSETRADVEALSVEVRPFIGLGRFLHWVPVVGGDLSMSESIIETAVGFTAAADQTYQGLQPIVSALTAEGGDSNVSEISKALIDMQPQLISAKNTLDEGIFARAEINVEQLSPSVHNLVVNKLDPYLQMLNDSLTVLLAAPKLLGASEDGPQTYLLLLQNEDELRATGGFITGVGTVVIKDGKIISFDFENSYDVDDWTKPYPSAPQPLRDYMNILALPLRDSNWSPDFPTSAALAEYLYAYTRFHSVDGVLAIDQHFLVSLLEVLGPIQVVDAPYPISSKNVIDYIRSQRMVYEENEQGLSVRKTFLQKIGELLLTKLQSGSGLPLKALQKAILKSLDEHHLLIQIDDQSMAPLLAQQGWDGAVRPGTNDFLMVVDANIGYNKSNGRVDETLLYDVDLTNINVFTASLTVAYENNAPKNVPCVQWKVPSEGSGEESYNDLMNRCYWDYLRIYKSADTILSGATPTATPGEWMIMGKDVPAHVDILDENIDGVQGFGTLLVVPSGSSLETKFSFTLPPQVLTATAQGSMIYQLRIQKQPGTLAIPITIRVRLPKNAVVSSFFPGSEPVQNEWQISATLREDLEIRIEFKNP